MSYELRVSSHELRVLVLGLLGQNGACSGQLDLLAWENLSFMLGIGGVVGYPLPLGVYWNHRVSGNLRIIYGAQWLRGKILSRKELGSAG